MTRVVWFGLGVALTVVVVVEGRRQLARAKPGAILEQASRKGADWWNQARRLLADFNRERRAAEAGLRQQHGLAAGLPDEPPGTAPVAPTGSALGPAARP
jgi:hypothetical protein